MGLLPKIEIDQTSALNTSKDGKTNRLREVGYSFHQ
jgi:hypothetical protein